MTPEQFSRLSEGDLIRNKNGHGFFVLENKSCAVLAQCILSVPRSRSEDWTLCARLEPVPQPPVAPKRPPFVAMHKSILEAGGLAIESKDGTKYRIYGRVFDTLESAWDTLPKVTPTGFKTIRCMREELFKIGWTMHTPSGGAEVTWSSPGGNQRIAGTRAAWEHVFGVDAP